MGYERKLFIVREYHHIHPHGEVECWADDIAMLDICKDYALDDVRWRKAEGDLLDTFDMDTEIKTDMYGDHIKSADPKDVLKVLKKSYEHSHYWREKLMIDMIESVLRTDNEDDLSDIKIYSFGY